MMGSKAKAALNRLKEIDDKYKYNKQDKLLMISSDSSNSDNEDKVLRPILNIKLPDPYEEYIDFNTDDDSEHVAVKVVDDTPRARSRQSSDNDSSENSNNNKSIKENNVKGIENLSSKVDEISEIIEDVSETVHDQVTDKSFDGTFSLDDRVMNAKKNDDEKIDSDEILTDKYSDSFESPESDASGSQLIKLLKVDSSSGKSFKKDTSVSESVEIKSNSFNYSISKKSSRSIATGEVTENRADEINEKENKNKVEIEQKLFSESVHLSDIIEDTSENKLPSLELMDNNLLNSGFCNTESNKSESKSKSLKSENSNYSAEPSKSSSHKSISKNSKKKSETIQTVSDNDFIVSTTQSKDYIAESTKSSSHKSIVKKSKKNSDSRQTVSDHEFIMSNSENNDSSSECNQSSSQKSTVRKPKKKTDTRQTVSDHEEYSATKKKYLKSSSSRNFEKKMKQSHNNFKQQQQRLNLAMIDYIQKMEEEHQRLLTWPKNLICPSRVNVKTVKPLELPNVSGFVRPDAKVNQDEDINIKILRNRLLDIRQWLKDQYLIYKEHYDLAASLNKNYNS